MKRKLLTVAMSLVLCLGMSVTAFAAPSPTGGADMSKTTGTQVSATAVLPKSTYTPAQLEKVNAIENQLYDIDESKGDSSSQIKANAKKIAASVGVSVNPEWAQIWEVPKPADGSMKVSFAFSGVTKGQSVIGLHIKNDGSVVQVPVVVETNNALTVTMDSFSPVLFIVEPASGSSEHTVHTMLQYTVAPTATTWGYTMHYCAVCGLSYADTYVAPLGTSGAAGTSATSPKTTESGLPMAMLFAAAALVGGAAVYAKRRIQL